MHRSLCANYPETFAYKKVVILDCRWLGDIEQWNGRAHPAKVEGQNRHEGSHPFQMASYVSPVLENSKMKAMLAT